MLSVSLLLAWGTIGFGEKPEPQSEITNSLGMKLKLIPAGQFMMGSPESDDVIRNYEQPQHKVRITQPFYLGVYEVTGRQVTVLASRSFTAASHSLTWNGRDSQGRAMPSGAYIVRLETDSRVEAIKVMLMR